MSNIVYLVKGYDFTGQDLYKIGWTSGKLKKRMNALISQGCNASKREQHFYDLKRLIVCVNKQPIHTVKTLLPKSLEEILHSLFSEFRFYREWFCFHSSFIPSVIMAMDFTSERLSCFTKEKL